MFDILPFPNITAKETDERVAQVIDYLLQFKEDLEFILTNLTSENLSPELQSKIASLKTSSELFTDEQSEQISQTAKKGGVTAVDILSSTEFIKYAEDATAYVNRKVDDLDYIVSGEQTKTSVENGGENIFTFRNNDGGTSTFIVRNGHVGSFSIDFTTGNLLYKEE